MATPRARPAVSGTTSTSAEQPNSGRRIVSKKSPSPATPAAAAMTIVKESAVVAASTHDLRNEAAGVDSQRGHVAGCERFPAQRPHRDLGSQRLAPCLPPVP